MKVLSCNFGAILLNKPENVRDSAPLTLILIRLPRAIMTHASVPKDQRIALGISDTLVSFYLTFIMLLHFGNSYVMAKMIEISALKIIFIKHPKLFLFCN